MVRVSFHEELGIAEQELLGEGGLVRKQIERVLEAVAGRDVDLAAHVIEEDDRVDEVYLDLRLVSAILHSNMHVERIGDLCVNIAKFVQNQDPYPSNSPMVTRLNEMGGHAIGMLDTALSAFAQRSAELAEELPGRDNALDRLNRGMLDDLKDYVDDDESFEWATKLVLVSRYLERMGDHAVDIGEQVAFLVTGVFREFTDASHPEQTPRG
jgi:phosphate transport system protein